MNHNWMPEFFDYCNWRGLDPYDKKSVDIFKEFKRAGLTF